MVGAVLYIASFGPWCWYISRRIGPDEMYPQEISAAFYRPIYLVWWKGPYPADEAIDWYANLFAADWVGPAELAKPRGMTETGDVVLDTYP